MASSASPSTYELPSRLVRKLALNTIMEDESDGSGGRDEREGRTRRRSIQVDRPTSTSSTTSISSYYHTRQQSLDDDELYTVSDDSDAEPERNPRPRADPNSPYSPTSDYSSRPISWASGGNKNKYPPLVIPSPGHWPTIYNLPKTSPVPPTPPLTLVISQKAFSKLTPTAPAGSAPPSLDGSLSSDQVATISAPPTPDVRCNSAALAAWAGRVEGAETPSDFNDEQPPGTPHIDLSMEQSQWHGPSPAAEHPTAEYPTAGLSAVAAASASASASAAAASIASAPAAAATASIASAPAPAPVPPASASAAIATPPSPDKRLPPVPRPLPKLVTISRRPSLGVQLPATAMETLRHLLFEPPLEPSSATEAPEMQEVYQRPTRPRSADMTPMSAISQYSYTDLSLPSPGGLFSSRPGPKRQTWTGFQFDITPTSATTEDFYNPPWAQDSKHIVEQVVELDDDDTEGPPTAIRVPLSAPSEPSPRCDAPPDVAITAEEQITTKDFDEDYEKEIWQSAEETFDRTSTWLAAQNSYLAALRTSNPGEESNELNLLMRRATEHIQDDTGHQPLKKAVKFVDGEAAHASNAGGTTKSNPLFYQAFQQVSNASSPTDSFVHRHARFDAVQAGRTSLAEAHMEQLLGHYYISDVDRPHLSRPISMMPGRGQVDQTPEQRAMARLEQERQAVAQLSPAMWIVEATRFLNGGRLLNSPVNSVLTNAPPLEHSALPSHVRVLDLGGQPQCDWSWHCARDFPNVKTYTATMSTPPTSPLRPPLRGPSNHRLVPVVALWRLPFPTNHFDVISARSLFMQLTTDKPLGTPTDQYDLVLRECLRVLKPGGYLEFFVLDAEVVHPGPLGAAASVEFAFALRARGYDPAPTRSWLARLRRAGLTELKRAWMFLPVGTRPDDPGTGVWPETPDPRASVFDDKVRGAEAVRGPVGSWTDAAPVSGLVGSWAWERWIAKLEAEMGGGRLLAEVGKVMEEGRGSGAGWRSLSGWGRKPL